MPLIVYKLFIWNSFTVTGCPPLIAYALYSALPPSQQMRVFEPTPKANMFLSFGT